MHVAVYCFGLLLQIRFGDIQSVVVADDGSDNERSSIVSACSYSRSHATLPWHRSIRLTKERRIRLYLKNAASSRFCP